MVAYFTRLLFLLLIAASLLLPSAGDHGLLAPKTLCFLAAFGSFCWYTLTYYRSLPGLPIFIFCSILFFLGIWALVGIEQSPLRRSGQLDQFKIFMTTCFTPIAGYSLLTQGSLTTRQLLRTTFFCSALYCTIKLLLVIGHLLGFFNILSWLELRGMRYMSMPIAGMLFRLQTSMDVPTPFLLFFALDKRAFLPRWFLPFYLLVATLSNILSFSRYLLFVEGIALLLFFLKQRFTKQIAIACATAACLVGATLLVGPAHVYTAIEQRLFSHANSKSDQVRHEQIEALWYTFEERPLLGQGLGGYAPHYIRDDQLLHSYEVQWNGFLMQFGLLGLIGILSGVGLVAYQLRHHIAYLCLFSCWLLSGFTNPFLISLTSGVIYLLFLSIPLTEIDGHFDKNQLVGL